MLLFTFLPINTLVVTSQITAEDGYAPLCTFLETILTMLWYQHILYAHYQNCSTTKLAATASMPMFKLKCFSLKVFDIQ